MMAESVNDVATVQQNLFKNLDDANAAILAQARLNREVQQELMAVRMVPFGSVTDRLYRIVRQTSKELGKRANLEIRGGQVEIDRSVLDKMGAPLEHMLRNAIAHGLEDRETRQALGKPEMGEITLSLAQEGNEIILSFSDDGAGLDFERIRARGIALGLLAADEVAETDRLVELIFTAGISTASELSQIAGRGIGMDIVKSEVTSLGGRIEVDSTPGHGTTFRLYIPLTLAVTQALLVRTGNRLYAIPSVMIEQVLDLKDAFSRLEAWQRWRELFGLAHIAVATRPGHELSVGSGNTTLDNEYLARQGTAADLAAAPAGRIIPFAITALEISATAIRERLARGGNARHLVPDAVLDYIDSHPLYRNPHGH